MDEWHPAFERTLRVNTQPGNSIMESLSSFGRVRVGLSVRGLGHISEEVLVEAISNFGAIFVSDRPVTFAK